MTEQAAGAGTPGTPAAGTPAPETPPAGTPPAGATPQASGSLIGKAAGESGAGGGADPNAGLPAAGNSELVGAPEGYGVYDVPADVQMDVDLVAELNGLAKDMNLSQVGAQKLVDLQVKLTQKQDTMAHTQFNEMRANWETETKKELGASYDAEMAFVRKTTQKFATPGLLQLLADTGVGNHKEMVAFMRTIGKTIAEDVPVVGAGSAGEKSAAETLFPSS